MIKHIVLFKFKDGISWSDPRTEQAEKALASLSGEIAAIKSWVVGRNFTDRPIAYDYAVIGDFEDREGLQAYIVHPAHQAGVKLWAEVSTWVLADIED